MFEHLSHAKCRFLARKAGGGGDSLTAQEVRNLDPFGRGVNQVPACVFMESEEAVGAAGGAGQGLGQVRGSWLQPAKSSGSP